MVEPQDDGSEEGADAGATDGSPGETESADSEETKPARPLYAGLEEADPIMLPGDSARGVLRTWTTWIARTIPPARKSPSMVTDWLDVGAHE